MLNPKIRNTKNFLHLFVAVANIPENSLTFVDAHNSNLSIWILGSIGIWMQKEIRQKTMIIKLCSIQYSPRGPTGCLTDYHHQLKNRKNGENSLFSWQSTGEVEIGAGGRPRFYFPFSAAWEIHLKIHYQDMRHQRENKNISSKVWNQWQIYLRAGVRFRKS